MSDTNAQEPTMEEILASIRRIISEDDAPAKEEPEAANEEPKAEAPAEPEPAPESVSEEEPEPEPEAELPPLPHEVEEEEDILELTDPEPEPAESVGDLDVFPGADEPAPPPRRTPEPAPLAAVADDEALISPPAADLAASAFGQLSRTVGMGFADQTLEEVVKTLLRPLLKDWLDQNLPGIVQGAVQAEVARISRRGR